MLRLSVVPAGWAAGAATIWNGPVEADAKAAFFPYP